MDSLALLKSAIEFVGGTIIAGYCIAALAPLLRRGDLRAARLRIAEGMVTGLNFKVAATLLSTIALRSWEQIGVFAVIFTLRTVVKWILQWERAQIRRSGGSDQNGSPKNPG